MTDTLALAPGCYGSPMSYGDDIQECRSCPFAESCKPESERRRNLLREKLGVEFRGTRPKRPKPEREPGAALTTGLPVKVEALLRRIEKAGIKVTEKLAKGENPFPENSIGFLRVTCHLLLHLETGLTREQLRMALMKKLNWTQGTAAAHAIQACQVLTALGAAVELNGRIMLKRA